MKIFGLIFLVTFSNLSYADFKCARFHEGYDAIHHGISVSIFIEHLYLPSDYVVSVNFDENKDQIRFERRNVKIESGKAVNLGSAHYGRYNDQLLNKTVLSIFKSEGVKTYTCLDVSMLIFEFEKNHYLFIHDKDKYFTMIDSDFINIKKAIARYLEWQ